MKKKGKLAPAVWAAVLLGSAGAGVGVVWVSGVLSPPAEGTPSPPAETQGPPGLVVLPESVAIRYAEAVQGGDAESAMAMTLWMVERLRRAALQTDDPSAVEAARAALREEITERTVEGNQLTPQGIEDKYIFANGASFQMAGITEGRDDLHVPATVCTWLRVTYLRPRNALRGEGGAPIRAVTVGIHESEDGLILKAGVVGNVEMDFDSISYDWEND